VSPPLQAARVYTHHCHFLLLLSPEADTHFTVPQRVDGWVDLGGLLHRLPSPILVLTGSDEVQLCWSRPRWLILRIPYTRHVSNAEVRRTTGCSLLSHLVTNRRLRLFGHIARSSPHEDHHRAFAACIWQVLPDWKRPAERPSRTWLRAIEADLGPLNFGLATAWRKANTRDEWRHIVDTATLQRSTLWKKKKKEGVNTKPNCQLIFCNLPSGAVGCTQDRCTWPVVSVYAAWHQMVPICTELWCTEANEATQTHCYNPVAPAYAPRSSRFGLEPPCVEDDVDVWRYAILELHARNDDNDDCE